MIDGIDEGLIKRMKALEEEVKGLKRMPLPARYVINVRDYGATGDGTTDDTAAIQAALDEVASFSAGKNIYTHVYFPTGQYLCNTSLDITNRWFFILRGDGWGLSVIVGAASGKPVLDLLGSRFFDIRDLTIKGDSTNTPSVAMFFGRTVTGPNCGNCWIENVALDGKFSAAALYNYRSEVFTINGLRSGPNDCDAPYIYYVSTENDLSVTSDYDTLDDTYNGCSQQRLNNWWVNTKSGGQNAHGIFLKGTHGVYAKNLYYNLYGGASYYHIILSGAIENISLDGIHSEGSATSGMKIDTANIARYTFSNVSMKGLLCTGSSILRHGSIEKIYGLASGETLTFEEVNYSKINQWWVYSNNNLTITSATGNYIEYPSGGTLTLTTDTGNVKQQLGTGYPLIVPNLQVGAAGTKITKFLAAVASLDFGSIAAGAEANLTITVTGAVYGDLALASPRNNTALPAGLVIKQVIAETDLVRIYLYNYSAGAIDPSAVNWQVAVIGF